MSETPSVVVNDDGNDPDVIDGRYMPAVNEYASTCDVCGELTHHELFAFYDEATQLGCCKTCFDAGILPLGNKTRPCTCLGTCRGASGLGAGWHCVLEVKS